MDDTFIIDSVFLEFKNKRLLNGVYLQIPANTIIGILGRNGTGKSSLFKIITGQQAANNRHITLNGRLLNKIPEKNILNYLPQFNCHPGSFTIATLLQFYEIDLPFWNKHYPSLQPFNKTKFGNLSTGQKR